MDRRSFLKGGVIAGAAGLAALGINGCAPAAPEPVEPAGPAGPATPVAPTGWLGEAPAVDDAAITNTIDVDVLVCGVGTGGVIAAGKAAAEGLKVLAIDKGNVTDVKTAIGSLNNKYQKAAGVVFDKQAIVSDMERYSSSGTDRRMLNTWADRSGEAVDFFASYMEKAGAMVLANSAQNYQVGYYEPWLIEIGVPDGTPMPVYAACFSDGTAALLADIAARGSEVRYKTALVKLEQNASGAVTGAIIHDENGSYSRVNASKGVILATGGYASNTDMLRDLQPETLEMISLYQMTCQADGDGIKAGLWAGGTMQSTHCSM
ncbi:MAG: FAD-binding protein, partial [Eggerthellaceae bacterium]|nr:FAD-binding protein [Eggerthellaceae bacterium]